MSGRAINVVQVGHADTVVHVGGAPSPPVAEPAGRPLSEFTPFDLEVHRSIVAAGGRVDPDSLPAYVARAHDDALRDVVRGAADGRSAIAVLVGGSSTGKTRACWEAIRSRPSGDPGGLPDGWRLWHPIDPSRPEAAIEDLNRIGPRTVVWLNETQHYLLAPTGALGERIAAGLRALLRDPGRAPVLVLGTLWPDYWLTLTHVPVAGAEDPHAQARALLEGASVPVPDAFSAGDMSAARAAGDPRVVEAVENSTQGQVAQYLAGGPALLERYDNAPPAPRAVLTAAVDARRLGHGVLMSADFLTAAAPGYLTDAQWDRLDDDWFAFATDYVQRPCHGGDSPLRRVRRRPGDPTGGDGEAFRLADYLEQQRGRTRRTAIPPLTLWEALVAHAPQGDRLALGGAAERRCLFELACRFYATADSREGFRRIARLLDRLERRDEALVWHRRAGEAGDSVGVRAYAGGLVAAGRAGEALAWLRSCADAGNTTAAQEAGKVLRERGRRDEALVWYRRAGEAGDSVGVRAYAGGLVAAGRVGEALAWLRSCADAGNTTVDRFLALLLVKAGHIDEALRRLRTRADTGDGDLLAFGARLLFDAGRIDDALEWARRAAESGEVEVQALAAAHLEREGRKDEALDWYRRAADAGDTDAAMAIGRLLEAVGRTAEAIARYQQIFDVDSNAREAAERAVTLMVRFGRRADAVAWLRTRAEAGASAMERWNALRLLSRVTDAAVDHVVPADEQPEKLYVYHSHPTVRVADPEWLDRLAMANDPLAVYQKVAEYGHQEAMRQVFELVARTHPRRKIEPWLRARIEAGDANLAYLLGDLADQLGRSEYAIAWYRRAADAGHAGAVELLVRLLRLAGRMDEARSCVLAYAQTFGREEPAAELLADLGEAKEAIACYQRMAEKGDLGALINAALLAERSGHTTPTAEWLQRLAEAGNSTALRMAGRLLEKAGRPHDALRWYLRDTEAGNASALEEAIHVLTVTGRKDKAQSLRRFGVAPEGIIARPWNTSDL
jgi:tetratricopeptide (TPR) repeat protein